jgi:fermentation-respiration switch protein FrsA (DUF1100 family)
MQSGWQPLITGPSPRQEVMETQPARDSSLGRASGLRRVLRKAFRLMVLLAVGYGFILVLAMIFEESLIYFPTRYPDGDWEPTQIAVEDAWFRASDGTKLHGWYVAHDDPQAFVLFCHGNAGNVSHRADQIRLLSELVRVSVLCLDYRGYGRSEGRPNERGVLSDARAARKWLAQRAGIDEKEIVLLGRSLGGAVIVDLASKDGARALVLESTFTSVPDMAAHYYPWLPVRMVLRTRLDALGKISNYHGPLFQSHGEADSIVPCHFGRRLFEAANQPKEFFNIPGGDHNELPPRQYYEALRRFLEAID